MPDLLTLAFGLAIALLIYAYAGFSLLVIIAARIRNQRVQQKPITPRLSLIIPVWNKERTIAERLENALSLDYPAGALEIIVASDGSDDDTEVIVAKYEARGVRLLSFPRRGKIHALKDTVASATGEILVFSDANSMYKRDAMRMLVRNFADPEIMIAPVDPAVVAKRMIASIRYEQLPFMEHYLPFKFAFPDRKNDFLDNVHEIQYDILRRALDGKEAYEVRHPYPVSFQELYNRMKPFCETAVAMRVGQLAG